MSNNILPGFYGKLPYAGDFVTRRLTYDFINPWDAWLQEALFFARQQLGGDFQDRYQNSPMWRFVMGPGSCGPHAAAGIMVSSTDRVGRNFPLILSVISEFPLVHLMLEGGDWFTRLEEIAGAINQNSMDLEKFDQQLQLQRLSDKILANGSGIGQKIPSSTNDPLFWGLQLDSSAQFEDVFAPLTHHLLEQHLSEYSIWSNAGAATGSYRFWVFKGLPPVQHYIQFLGNPEGGGDK